MAQILDDYELESHHSRILLLAAEAWDRGLTARQIITRKGMTFEDRFGQPKPRPEIAIERDSRLAFARLVRELGLDSEELDAPRPPRPGGYK